MMANKTIIEFINKPFIPTYGIEKTFKVEGISCKLFVYPDKTNASNRHLSVAVRDDFVIPFYKTSGKWQIESNAFPQSAERSLNWNFPSFAPIKNYFMELLNIN